ncbi:MAG: cysteine desulfurase family protein [Pirellula sp.]
MIYLDNHATTRTDPTVVADMVRFMEEHYANPGSTTHEAGREAGRLVGEATKKIASCLNAESDEIVMTSGATESNNLALFGVAFHPKQRRRRIVSLITEHRALLDPLLRLERSGFEVVRLPVFPNEHGFAGGVDLNRLVESINEDTALVSVMLANNEIGTIQPIAEIAKVCKRFEIPLHTDASQAVGRMSVDVSELGVDLLSFSAHKFYGPKGIGGLYVRQSPTPVRIQAQILGGGQQSNLRSGTLNSVGIIGMSRALELANSRCDVEMAEQAALRNLLWDLLNERIEGLGLNGPRWGLNRSSQRLAGNLNVCFPKVEGQSLMLALPELAVSSGSACTSAEPHPSHVLLSLGLSEDQARASLRFGIGRFNTEAEIRQTADWLVQVHAKLVSFVA